MWAAAAVVRGYYVGANRISTLDALPRNHQHSRVLISGYSLSMFWIAKLITHITIHANLRPLLYQPHPGQFFSSKTTNESITISEPPQHHLNSPNVTSSWMLWSGCWMKHKIKIDVLFWKKSLKIVCFWFPALAWAFWWYCVDICICICNWEERGEGRPIATGGFSLMGWCSKKFFLPKDITQLLGHHHL